jgi:predicted phosphodiesterase
MRYGIIADVHANKPALQSVLKHAEKHGVDSWYFLGDAVGYGPFPLETIRLLQTMVPNNQWVIGNHDASLVGLLPLPGALPGGNEDARWTIQEHQKLLQEQDEPLWRWCLETWNVEKYDALNVQFPNLNAWFVHASLRQFNRSDQVERYLLPWPLPNGVDYKPSVFNIFANWKTPGKTSLLFHGHSHIPCALGIRTNKSPREYLAISYDMPINLGEFDAMNINPGSVGQPRNADPGPHAAYGILDTETQTFQFHRTFYDVDIVIDELFRNNYPEDLRWLLRGSYPENVLWKREKKPWTWLMWQHRYRWNDNGWDVNSQE